MIPIYKPYLTKKSLSYAHEALDSGWISSTGKYIQLAQEKLENLLNIKHAILLNNGTSACHLMARTLSKKLNKKQIICPSNTYIAAQNAFLFDNNYELIIINCDLNTWNYDLQALDQAIKLYPEAAVLIVHNISNIINVPNLKSKYPATIFLEDACEGLFGMYNNKYVGTESYCSAVSFYANKTVCSGESGSLLTNDEDAYLYAKCVQGQGQSEKRFVHSELGTNFRATNIQAALLFGQLEVLPDILNMKQQVFDTYRKAFSDREDCCPQTIEKDTIFANWMFGIRIIKSNYEEAELYFKNKGIEIRPMFYPIYTHNHIKNNNKIKYNKDFNAELLNKECIILPSYPELTKEQQKYIINTVEEYIKSL
jgi:perosamine synthetase